MGSYAGVDWAADKHDVLVADEAGEELLAATFAHDEQGLRSLCRQLVRLGVELVAIERPDGLLVERLLDAGLRVLALHPNQVAATRPRFRVSGGKSDRFDAFVLCELARTDHHRFRVLEPDADQTTIAKGPRSVRVRNRAHASNVPDRTRLSAPATVCRERSARPTTGPCSSAHRVIAERPPSLVLTACPRPATNRKQRGTALRTVALPTGPPVGQGYLTRVRDRDLLAADASTLGTGILYR